MLNHLKVPLLLRRLQEHRKHYQLWTHLTTGKGSTMRLQQAIRDHWSDAAMFTICHDPTRARLQLQSADIIQLGPAFRGYASPMIANYTFLEQALREAQNYRTVLLILQEVELLPPELPQPIELLHPALKVLSDLVTYPNPLKQDAYPNTVDIFRDEPAKIWQPGPVESFFMSNNAEDRLREVLDQFDSFEDVSLSWGEPPRVTVQIRIPGEEPAIRHSLTEIVPGAAVEVLVGLAPE